MCQKRYQVCPLAMLADNARRSTDSEFRLPKSWAMAKAFSIPDTKEALDSHPHSEVGGGRGHKRGSTSMLPSPPCVTVAEVVTGAQAVAVRRSNRWCTEWRKYFWCSRELWDTCLHIHLHGRARLSRDRYSPFRCDKLINPFHPISDWVLW